jgi:hypothetical protein
MPAPPVTVSMTSLVSQVIATGSTAPTNATTPSSPSCGAALRKASAAAGTNPRTVRHLCSSAVMRPGPWHGHASTWRPRQVPHPLR